MIPPAADWRPCQFTVRGRKCGHPKSKHEYDEADGSHWCITCWGSDLDDLAYHAFEP